MAFVTALPLPTIHSTTLKSSLSTVHIPQKTRTPITPLATLVPLPKAPSTVTEDLTTLGSLQVSSLGVGTWAWGDRLFWGYGRGDYTDDDLYAAYKVCRDAGINLFDTAEVYGSGRSEKLCGDFGRRYDGNDKGEVFVATKYMPVRLGRKTVEKACGESMKRLGTEVLDLYQLHFPNLVLEERVWDELAELYQRGLVKNVGVSNYSQKKMKDVYDRLKERDVPLSSNQVQYSLLYRNPETNGIMETANELGIKILAYSPLEKGILTGKYRNGSQLSSKPTGARRLMYRDLLPKTTDLLKELEVLAQKYDKSISQVSLNWVICKGAIPIPGCKTAKQATDNAGAMGWRLSSDDIDTLDQASESLKEKNRAAFNLDNDRLVPEI